MTCRLFLVAIFSLFLQLIGVFWNINLIYKKHVKEKLSEILIDNDWNNTFSHSWKSHKLSTNFFKVDSIILLFMTSFRGRKKK